MLRPEDLNRMDKSTLIALVQELGKQVNTMSEELDTKSKELDTALQLIEIYKESIASLNLQIYGAKSEKRTPITEPLPDNTFNDAEVLADPSAPEETVEEIQRTYRGKKKKGKREMDFEGLPVIQEVHDIPEDQHDCPNCDGTLRCIGSDVRKELVEIPRQIYVVEHITPKYICDECEKHSEKSTILKADSPKPVIPNSGLASSSLISSIVFRKFFMGLPLYRQEKEYKLNGIKINRQNMANWMIHVAANYFKPLYDIMHEELKKSLSIHCDETPVIVLKEPSRPKERSKNSKSYFWLFQTGRSEKHPIVLFKYSHSRAHDIPKEFLKDFNNYAHVDGYSAYHKIKGIAWVGCWSHCRRLFMDVYKLIPPKDRNKEPLQLCEIGLNYIDRLFTLEKEFADFPYDKVFEERQKLSLPIIDEFFTWVHDNLNTVIPTSKIGTALTYANNQESYLRKYLVDGRLEISNNRAERSIRPISIGKKNWLFANTEGGAEASAILYSFTLTAIENSLDPFKYIELVLNELAQITPSNFTHEILTEYLPYSDYVISKCKTDLTNSVNDNIT